MIDETLQEILTITEERVKPVAKELTKKELLERLKETATLSQIAKLFPQYKKDKKKKK